MKIDEFIGSDLFELIKNDYEFIKNNHKLFATQKDPEETSA